MTLYRDGWQDTETHIEDIKIIIKDTFYKEYGDAYIELLELCSCSSKEELLKKEGDLIRNTDCENKQIPNRKKKERKKNIEKKLRKKNFIRIIKNQLVETEKT